MSSELCYRRYKGRQSIFHRGRRLLRSLARFIEGGIQLHLCWRTNVFIHPVIPVLRITQGLLVSTFYLDLLIRMRWRWRRPSLPASSGGNLCQTGLLFSLGLDLMIREGAQFPATKHMSQLNNYFGMTCYIFHCNSVSVWQGS